uniref:Protein kinase domain-containing protein n=1 Tax=Quercus lobata TaxID=97700 RepID=A0A7N2MU77_QUELO
MVLNSRALVLLHILVWSLPDTLTLSSGTLSDITCLKSIRDSLEDPLNHIATSWTFNNLTEGSICGYVGVSCGYISENRVRGVQLANMGLKGKFPRGLVDCRELIILDLSGNEISGSIPRDISEILPAVEVLKLSNNNLSGEIPSSMGNCSNLEVLILDNNRLTGQIPQQLNQLIRLEVFSVANNLLSGPVPDFVNVTTIKSESYVNNSELCGGPLDCCKKHRWSFEIEISFRSGFVVGFVVFAFSYTAFFTYYFNLGVGSNKRNKMPTSTTELTATRKNIEWQMIIDPQISQLGRKVTRVSFVELKEATGNFSRHNYIGLGKIGIMYKAMLPNGCPLAVKRIYGSESFEKQFKSELSALARLRHDNIISLLGYSGERNEMLLVYQYISNGNLYDWLHTGKDKDKILDWPSRIKIAIGIARGLACLHHNCHLSVVHLSLSSNAILLDQNFEAKISNFGEAIILKPGGLMFVNSSDNDLSNRVFDGSGVRELDYYKKDVYDFGILLLELITGKAPIQINNYSNRLDGSYVDWITCLLTCPSLMCNFIDKSLIGSGFDNEIFQLLRIASACIKPLSCQRPTTLELYHAISILGENYGLINNDTEILRQSEISTTSTSNKIVEVEST